jgi:hypothetical protein
MELYEPQPLNAISKKIPTTTNRIIVPFFIVRCFVLSL